MTQNVTRKLIESHRVDGEMVPGADIGERVKIEVTEVKSNFAVGEIVDEGV